MDYHSKQCTKCQEVRPLDEFHNDRTKKDGKNSACKRCATAKSKDYYSRNKEAVLQSKKAYRSSNPDKIRKRESEYRKANPDKVRARDVSWVERNRDKKYAANAKRRALKIRATVEDVCYEAIRKRDATCYLCLELFTDKERFDTSLTQVDHKIPLSRGGEHSYENCALTHKECNLSKGTKTPEEYLEATLL